MRPLLNRPGKEISSIFLVDVSRSIAPEFLSAAIQWSGEAVEAGQPAHSRFIGFAAQSAIVERAEELGSLAVYDGASVESGARLSPGAIDQSRTNIERALRQALTSFAPHKLRRLVLITDGHETDGVSRRRSRRAPGARRARVHGSGRGPGRRRQLDRVRRRPEKRSCQGDERSLRDRVQPKRERGDDHARNVVVAPCQPGAVVVTGLYQDSVRGALARRRTGGLAGTDRDRGGSFSSQRCASRNGFGRRGRRRCSTSKAISRVPATCEARSSPRGST